MRAKKRDLLLQMILYIHSLDGRRVKAGEMSKRFKIKERDVPGNSGDWGNFRNTRQLLKDAKPLGLEYGIGIGSGGDGYYLIKTGGDWDEFQHYMNTKILGIKDTLKKVEVTVKNQISSGVLREAGLLN